MTRLPFIGCRVLLAVVFLLAAMHKLVDPEAFAWAIYQYGVLPSGAVNAVAITLPWIEVTAALALLGSPRWRQGGALLLLVLLGVFVTAMLINLVQGAEIACGCFSHSPEAEPLAWRHVGRNLSLMLLTAVVLAE